MEEIVLTREVEVQDPVMERRSSNSESGDSGGNSDSGGGGFNWGAIGGAVGSLANLGAALIGNSNKPSHSPTMELESQRQLEKDKAERQQKNMIIAGTAVVALILLIIFGRMVSK